jgi:carbonic anhydrase
MRHAALRSRNWVALCIALVGSAAFVTVYGSNGQSRAATAAHMTSIAPRLTADPEAESSPKWSYTGANGPTHWGSLDPAYRACATGRRQSPINLAHAMRGTLPPLRFSYGQSTFELHNNGHSVEADAGPGNTVSVSGVAYRLVQFHYHAPSEHRIDGRSFVLELHLVNESTSGQLLVLGVLIRPGRANPAFDRLIAALPTHDGQHSKLTGLNPLSLVPNRGRGARYAYSGSLTTPPCTEGVRWNVFATPLELSRAQIRRFTVIYDHHNRPLQPRNGRPVVLGAGASDSAR